MSRCGAPKNRTASAHKAKRVDSVGPGAPTTPPSRSLVVVAAARLVGHARRVVDGAQDDDQHAAHDQQHA
eukprot:5959592-Prymnesium_polylepis.1